MKIPTGTVTFPRLGTWSSAWVDMVRARWAVVEKVELRAGRG
jgi:hypothetical protein